MKDLFNIKVIATGKTVTASIGDTYSNNKEAMKGIRNDMNNEEGYIRFCITRGKDNLKSTKPHSRRGSLDVMRPYVRRSPRTGDK